MRTWFWLTLLAFVATLTLSDMAQARVNTPCPMFARPCECAWQKRDCPPTCHIQLRFACASA